MKIVINEQQTELLGKSIIKFIMKMYGDIVCFADFDSEPDDDGKFWVNIYFKEDWYDSLTNAVREVRIKSGEIRNNIYQFMGIDIRVGISLKNC
jgi:hypothetical protein